MAKVTGKVLKPFSYKGQSLKEGDEATLDVKHAARYERNDYIKLNREAEKKVEAAEEKKLTKEDAPAPKQVKTK